jgi:hypothetical protein
MSESTRLRRPRTDSATNEPYQTKDSEYFPPCSFLLEKLGISAADMHGHGTATVSRSFLRALIGELAGRMRFDQEWYAEKYPDVEGARLAGDVQSLYAHFRAAGYFEGRLPAELPFDPQWYRTQYRDIAETFLPSDAEGMRTHFLTSGYFEGRAGTAEAFAEAKRWQVLANG